MTISLFKFCIGDKFGQLLVLIGLLTKFKPFSDLMVHFFAILYHTLVGGGTIGEGEVGLANGYMFQAKARLKAKGHLRRSTSQLAHIKMNLSCTIANENVSEFYGLFRRAFLDLVFLTETRVSKLARKNSAHRWNSKIPRKITRNALDSSEGVACQPCGLRNSATWVARKEN